jgi:Xaa-Pro aminopeptidase
MPTPDELIRRDDWSDLARFHPLPIVDKDRLHRYRLGRLRAEMARHDVALALLHNPVSLRYAINYRNYGLFQSRIPSAYVLIPANGPVVLCGGYSEDSRADDCRPGRALAFFDGGFELAEQAGHVARDLSEFLSEVGESRRRIAIEAVNPTLTLALAQYDFDVIDGTLISEHARVIKSEDELACMRWSIAVAEHGIAQLERALQPGVSELQLWGLLNYTNLANDGDWHDGRMLASGPRINPWLQEASPRRVEAGDLVGFDTDMVGPFGYFADVSRTLFCGPGSPSRRQRELYQTAVSEIQHNVNLLKPGLRFSDFQQRAWPVPEEFWQNAYPCVVHAVGMCDEYPRVNPVFRGPTPYDGQFEAGMVICVESYIGAVGERDGVKLEQQVLITDSGVELLSGYPLDESLMS